MNRKSPTFGPKKETIFIATGDTYPHRELFQSWAWHWDGKRGAWVEDNLSKRNDLCIMVIRDLPGVSVQEVEITREGYS